jgi:hypothetical protein
MLFLITFKTRQVAGFCEQLRDSLRDLHFFLLVPESLPSDPKYLRLACAARKGYSVS